MQDSRQDSQVLSDRPALVAGLAVVVLAAVVIAGWLTKSPSLVHVLQGAPPMRFNTAGLLLVVGISFIGLAGRRFGLVRYLAAFVAAVAAATIIEYLLVLELGIDNLIIQDWSGQGPNPSGRMAVNTALCFLLIGCSLLSLSPPHRVRWQPLLGCLCGAIVFAIGIVAAFGYLAGIDGAFGWFGSGGMAIHTALTLGVCGATLVVQSLKSDPDWSSGRLAWLPLPVAIAICTISCVIWQALRLEVQKETYRVAASRTESLADELEDRIEEQIAALERMAHRWEIAGPPTKGQWRADASLYLKHYPDLLAIAWVNPAGRICWIIPESGNEEIQGWDLTAEEARRRTFEAARDRGRTAITSIVKLIQGDEGIVAMCPIGSGDTFAGCINAAFRLSVLVEEAARHDLQFGYRVNIFEGSRRVFGPPVGADEIGAGTADRFASMRGLNLRVRVTPTERVVAAQRSSMPEIVLAAGIAFAILASLLVHFTQQASSRHRVAEHALEALRNSERKFRGIFDQTFQFIGLLSPAGAVLEANRSALAFAGISEAEVIGKPFWETPWWTHSLEQQQILRDAIQRAAGGEMIRLEATHPSPDGSLHYIDFSLKPVLDDAGCVTMLIPEGRDITDRKRAEEQLARAARLDKLTGLPNRGLLIDRLQQTILRAHRSGQHNYAVLFLDFDRFKLINDSLGHDAGDALLRQIAQRMQEHVRAVDSVSRSASGNTTARLGGDEFVVLLDELESPGDVLIVADRLLAAFARPYQIGNHEVVSTASIGVVTGDVKYDRAEDVVRDADTAMYEAKRAGKDRYVIFDRSMLARAQRRLQLEVDLRKALEGGQLSLAYQPIVSLTTGEIASAEALLRWDHPVEGPIPPDEFIPIAEESDLILDLGNWVLLQACRQMAEWTRSLGSVAPATVSVNLSHRQLSAPNLRSLLERVLAETGLKPERLQLEVSEVALTKNQVGCALTMHDLRTLGVQFAMDDFGTGSLSFAAVHRFPVQMLKVDECLCSGVEAAKDAAALLHALAVLVKNLGVSLVAEGVESIAQARALQDLGCDCAQGFIFASPLHAAEFERYLSRSVAIDHEAAGAMAFANRWAEHVVS